MRPAQGCVGFCYLTPPSLVLWLPNISTVHTQTNTYAHSRTYWPRRVYSEWGQAPWIPCLAPDFFLTLASHSLLIWILFSLISIISSQVCSLLVTKKKQKTFFSFLSGNKNKPNGKTNFFIYFFFSNSRHNVYQYSHLSVCLHSKVQCANITSHKLLDCLLVCHSPQLTSLLSVL